MLVGSKVACCCWLCLGCLWLVSPPCVGVCLVPGGDLAAGALRADVEEVPPVGGVDGVLRLVEDRPRALAPVTAPHHQPEGQDFGGGAKVGE